MKATIIDHMGNWENDMEFENYEDVTVHASKIIELHTNRISENDIKILSESYEGSEFPIYIEYKGEGSMTGIGYNRVSDIISEYGKLGIAGVRLEGSFPKLDFTITEVWIKKTKNKEVIHEIMEAVGEVKKIIIDKRVIPVIPSSLLDKYGVEKVTLELPYCDGYICIDSVLKSESVWEIEVKGSKYFQLLGDWENCLIREFNPPEMLLLNPDMKEAVEKNIQYYNDSRFKKVKAIHQ